MLSPMVVWLKRYCWFTMLLVSMFTVGTGCAGMVDTYGEPNTAVAYTGEEAESPGSGVVPPYSDEDPSAGNGEYEDTDPSALTEFRAELEPYGAWVDDTTYGTVWIPSVDVVGQDFAPYVSSGHWGMSEEGDWIWVSDYPWGWATFHYGRWIWIPGRGWAWIAGRRYAPAWVTWRVGYDSYDYIGWAPMPPTYYWSGGVAISLWYTPTTPYVFCESSYVFAPHVHHHIITGPRVGAIAPHTRPYVAASPRSAGSRVAASPSFGQGLRQHRRIAAQPGRGPSLADAHVPPSAGPQGYARPHARAAAMAHASNGGIPSPRTSGAGSPSRYSPNSSGRVVSGGASIGRRPVYAGRPAGESAGSTRQGSAPARFSPRSLGTSNWGASPQHSTAARPSYGSSPTYRAPSSSSHFPSFGGSPSYRSSSTPSYRSPAYSSSHSRSFGTSPSFHAPTQSSSHRPSTSTPTVRPSSRPSSGGRHRR